MKKAIKKYLTQLHENEEKGFSLVELIIVMAIMAILVGVVASQVIPYMEKSRQSRDQQQLSSLATDIVSSVAQSGVDVAPFSDKAVTDADLGAALGTEAADVLKELRGNGATPAASIDVIGNDIKGKLKSKKAKTGATLEVSMAANGVVKVQMANGSHQAVASKLVVTTE